VLNIVSQKLQYEGKYTPLGRHTAQKPAWHGDEMAKLCKKIINDAIFEA
jgi:hypothetical protein